MSLTYAIDGLDAAVAGLRGLDIQANTVVKTGIADGVQRGAEVAKSHAMGPPGPSVVTGDFLSSITGEVLSGAGSTIIGSIGSSSPYARRLEFGFVGADSLGRVYNQGPRPWLAPSVPEIEEALVSGIISRLDGAFV